VVRKAEAEFLGMAKLGDMLDVHTLLLESTRSTILLRQQVLKEGEVIFSAKILLVYVVEGRPRRIPPSFNELIRLLGKYEQS